ncbi:hypothetical protein BKA65DRAFT_582004 [Rhexocercosporidium sp. MPI-PUGE-AT-0058]|nr:hypothetical protein BKA65DRAFT_582004 [Rhexocercosporidium sp. MPI-PUGE-AT-0058]
MNPLTAFSVTGTVIRFINFSSKLLLQAHGLYKSTSGVLTVNQELKLMRADAQRDIRKLEALTTEAGSSQDPDKKKLNETFLIIRDEATGLATGLMTKLELLKGEADLRGHQRAWASLSLQSCWEIRNRGSIPDLLNRQRTLPRELEPLYDHLLDRIKPAYYPWASKTFSKMKMSQQRRAVLQVCSIKNKDHYCSLREF